MAMTCNIYGGECDGCMECQLEDATVCDNCGQACETVYQNRLGVTLGCEHCVSVMDAWEVACNV